MAEEGTKSIWPVFCRGSRKENFPWVTGISFSPCSVLEEVPISNGGDLLDLNFDFVVASLDRAQDRGFGGSRLGVGIRWHCKLCLSLCEKGEVPEISRWAGLKV